MTEQDQVAKNLSAKIWLAFIGFIAVVVIASSSQYLLLSDSIGGNSSLLNESKIKLAVLETKMIGLSLQIKEAATDRYTGTQAKYINAAFDRRLNAIERKLDK